MGLPQGVIPKETPLTAYRARTARYRISLYEDEGKTKAFNLTGWTEKLTIHDGSGSVYLTLASGTGLVVTPAAGLIVATLTPSQNTNAPRDLMRWVLDLEEGAEEVEPVLFGPINFVTL